MRDLDLTTLRLFVQVCETGSLARASLATRRKVHFEETLDFEHAGLPVTSASAHPAA
jgi:hypothetical protein